MVWILASTPSLQRTHSSPPSEEPGPSLQQTLLALCISTLLHTTVPFYALTANTCCPTCMRRRPGMPSSHAQGRTYTSDSCRHRRCQPRILCLVHKLVEWSMLTSRDGERVEVLGNVLQCLPSLFYCAFLLCFRNWHIALAPS